MGIDIETEARETYADYVRTRGRAIAGEVPWGDLAAFFTEDAVFIDPAWGRVEGRAAIEAFMNESMTGLEGWDFPEVWTMVDADRLVTMWDQVLPPDESGDRRRQPGLSVLHYAGDRQFSYEMDLLNMVHVLDDIKASGWTPGPGFTVPPAAPIRNWSRPSTQDG